MTRTVIFDVDGVLIHGIHANPAHVRRWDTTLQADLGVDPARFLNEFIFDIFSKRVITGQVSIIEALEKRLPGLGYKGSPMVFLNYWLEHDSVINHDLFAIIRDLKARHDIQLYIATNQEHQRAQWLWGHLRFNELFDDMFYSARVGVRKPDPAFFAFVEVRIGPQSEPPLFFDDSPAVVAGALKAGWDAVLFNTVDDCITHPWVSARLAETSPS